jgi:ribose 5-phosphate isomerase A
VSVTHVTLTESNPKRQCPRKRALSFQQFEKWLVYSLRNTMSTSSDAKKRAAAIAALESLRAGMRLGIGTGSTVNHFIDALASHAARIEAVVSSSEASSIRLRAIGVETSDLNEVGELDLYVDGADEATRSRCLVKGGGGALTREKIVAAASKRFVCIVDDAKLVERLGRFPLPIEVIPMARTSVAHALARFGGRPVWRRDFITDNGNHILDVHELTIDDPVGLEREMNQIPGVVTVGLFAIRPADVLIVGTDKGTMEI